MSSDELNPPVDRPPLTPAAKGVRLAFIGGVLAVLVGTFAYLGGWLTPHRMTPAAFANAFERADGVHPGFRRNHAKGVCVSGWFDANGQGVRLSKAAVFATGRSDVVGRFSFGGGNPNVADSPTAVRGLGVQFTSADGQQWRSAMINLPVFIVRTPQAFYERLVASAPLQGSGKPDPAKMAAFVAAHPETTAAMAIVKQHPPTSGFADTTFRGLNAFRFTAADGTVTPVRWELDPEDPAKPAPTTGPATAPGLHDPNDMFDALIGRIVRGPARWHLVVTVGQSDDPTNDATLPWPPSRERVDVGTLTFDKVLAEADTPTAALNFDPLVLPVGIGPSDDPLLSARSAVYSRSFTRRAGEAGEKPPSAITPADIPQAGGRP